MFYLIIGSENLCINKDYIIKPYSLEKEKRYSDDADSRFQLLEKERVALKLYGIIQRVDLKWLFMLARCRLYLPAGFSQHIIKYKFVESYQGFSKNGNGVKQNNKLPFHILFSSPVYYNNKLRIIAEFPDYAIGENKELFSIKENRMINFGVYADNSYRYARMFSGYFMEIQNKALHILAAITWIPNDDYIARPIVNHKDGDKRNWTVSNLEWNNHSENLIHAYSNGLRTDNRPIKMYDKIAKKTTIFTSVTEAFKSFGAKPRQNLESLFKERNGYYIARNRYEIRYLSDKNDFILKTVSVNKAIKNSGIITNRLYQAINIDTKEEIIGGNTAIQKALNISESAVTAIARKKTFYNNWIIRYYSDMPLDLSEYSLVANKQVYVVGTNLETKEKITFKSLREAGRISKYDPITIKRSIKNCMSLRDWHFEYLKKE